MQTKSNDQTQDGRILWIGPLFGRLPRWGRDFLKRKGAWREVDGQQDCNARLRFIWPNKTGPQFEMHDTKAAHVRPYPKATTDILDDKVSLAQLLEDQPENAPRVIQSPEEADATKLYFVKHKFGAQGKSVYVYNKPQLIEWWRRTKNAQDFVIQEEVLPALDEEGRKFVLRVHCLVLQRSDQPLQSYVHREVICIINASPYDHGESHDQTPNSAYVSQKGKKHPPPMLLRDLPIEHPAQDSWAAICRCIKRLLFLATTATNDNHPSNPFQEAIASQTSLFALLGADLLVAGASKFARSTLIQR